MLLLNPTYEEDPNNWWWAQPHWVEFDNGVWLVLSYGVLLNTFQFQHEAYEAVSHYFVL